MTQSVPPIALTVAGSDSGGGAGVEADVRTFHAFGVHGTAAVTAVTAQNTLGIRGVHPVPPEMVRLQIDAVVEDLRPAALKSGMLHDAMVVSALAGALEEHRLHGYVLDPVLVASGGSPLLTPDGTDAMVRELLPRATLVTPNLPEAEILTGKPVRTLADMEEAARTLVRMGAGAALVKGGHLSEDEAVDLLWDGEEERRWRRPRIETRHTHGTGCALSAACAAGLARGLLLHQAVDEAVVFVSEAIASAQGLGSGEGPINPFVRTSWLEAALRTTSG